MSKRDDLINKPHLQNRHGEAILYDQKLISRIICKLVKFTKFRVIPIIFTGAVMGHPYCLASMPSFYIASNISC